MKLQLDVYFLGIEDDPSTGVYYIGRGSYPNENGIIQLDAAVMRGKDCAMGAVCSIEGISKPISVARHLMEYSKHKILTGKGAMEYAKSNGFVVESNDNMLSANTKKAYEEYKDNGLSQLQGYSHDTLSILCLDSNGEIAAGVSTAGPPFKPDGRVGDSPLPGCGYYADSKVGAAAATGNGECIMKFCPSFHIMELLRNGHTPQDACEVVVKSMINRNTEWFEVGLIAMDIKGNVGACGTVQQWRDVRSDKIYDGFPYAMWKKDKTPPTVLTQLRITLKNEYH